MTFCSQCGKEFRGEGWLANHLLRVHGLGSGAVKHHVQHYGWLDAMKRRMDELEVRVERLEVVGGMSPREAREYLADAKELREEERKVGSLA